MSKFTKELVDEYANKLLFRLTPDENEMVLNEFNIIEDSMNKIASMPDINDIEPMTHCLDEFTFVLREDLPEESISTKDAFKNCGSVEDGEVSVPKVVG